jgi:uncharacterized protein (DUF1697 family)
MGTFAAMLRSVNVGGRNRVAMADLRDVVSSLGFADVSTYLQSGNVVFTGPGTSLAAARAIESRMATELELAVPVVVRSASQLGRVLEANPFAATGVDPRTVHTTFLGGRPAPARVQELEATTDGRSGDDRFEIIGNEVFLLCPGSYADTKVNNTYLERRLGVSATTRNWRTVTALAERAATAGR